MLTSAFALATALALGAPSLAPLVELSLATYGPGPAPRPDLGLHLAAPGAGGAAGFDGGPHRHSIAGLPVCSADVCQAVVSVPGFDPRYDSSRNARADAFAALLARARVEPFATVGRALVVTGVRVDYSPAVFESPSSGAHGWGSVQLRLRLRLDAHNAVVIPPIPK